MTELHSTNPNNQENLIGHFIMSEEFTELVSCMGDEDPRLQKFFEHGQWWIVETTGGASWSVHDSEDGYCFEQVSEGEYWGGYGA